jgi:hypothetical protein
MGGFSSFDNFIDQITTFKRQFKSEWNKNFLPTTAATASEWHSLFRGAGNPSADSLLNTGTNLLFQQVKETTAGATGIRHGGNVGGDTPFKIFLSGSAFTLAATVAPAIVKVIDIIGFYRVTSVTTATAQSTTNTLSAFGTFTADDTTDIVTFTGGCIDPYTKLQVSTTTTLPAGLLAATNYWTIPITGSCTTCKLATSYANAIAGTAIDITNTGTGTHTINTLLPRYTSGAGVQAFFVNTNATPLGAATPNLSLGYTNSDSTASRATPTVLPIGKTAAANGLILYSGTGVGKYNFAMPLQGSDSGIQSIETIQNSVSYVSGEYSVVLFKEVAEFPITTLGVPAERDFLSQLPSGERIYDGACLSLLLGSAVATPTNSSISGVFNFGWSK